MTGGAAEGARAGASPPDGLARRLGRELVRIRYRLLLVNVLIVAVPIVGIGFARFYEREMLRGLEADMINQAYLLRQVLLADPAGPRLDERSPLLAAAARDTRTRVRLLDAAGRVAADSHREGPPEGPEERPAGYLPSRLDPRAASRPPASVPVHARPEVREALAGRYGAATRVWPEGDRVFLFVALPLPSVTRDVPREAGPRAPGKGAGTLGVVYVTRSTNPVRFAMYRLRTTLFKVLGLAVLVTAVLSLFLAATIARPLSRLTRIARRIAGGDRTARLDELDGEGRADEIGELARAFDAMTRRLDERARFIAGLAANISHEFKSPITSIRGAAELLRDGAADDPAARARFLGNILADASRLDRLVTRLLELARVESDAAPVEAIDLAALVDEAARIATVAGEAPIDVEGDATGPGARVIDGRRAHLVAALANLLDNARQHAAPRSRVTLTTAAAADGAVAIAVHNEGAPISAANLARIWDRFFTTRARHGGTGLGLPIVAAVAAAHGGRVEVESDAGRGTTFTITLPARAPTRTDRHDARAAA